MAKLSQREAGNMFIFFGVLGVIAWIVTLFSDQSFNDTLYLIGGSIAAILLGYGSVKAADKAEKDRWKNL